MLSKYDEAKKWNKTQSGGSRSTCPFYEEIDKVMCDRDITTLTTVLHTGYKPRARDEAATATATAIDAEVERIATENAFDAEGEPAATEGAVDAEVAEDIQFRITPQQEEETDVAKR